MDDNGDRLVVDGELVLYGFVGDDFFGDGFTSSQVVRALAQIGPGDVSVRVNSGGGSAFDGAAIHAALKAHPGNVTVRVEGLAASAASLLAMAGDEIVMSEGAMMMIHDPSGLTMGTAADHEASADALNRLADNYAEVYARRSGKKREEVRELMLAETWLSAAEAVEAGFATRAEDGDGLDAAAAFDFTIYAKAPAELRELSEAKGWRFQSEGGAAAAHTQEVTMTSKTDPAAAHKAAAPETPPATPPAEPNKETQMSAEDVKKAQAAAVEAERKRAKSIRETVATLKLEPQLADEMIDEGIAADEAREKAIAKWAEQGDTHEHKPAPTARVTRDERETMRMGMEAALEARLTRKEPETDAARPYMDMRLAEMAAHTIGHRGSLLSYGDRENVIRMAASHSTDDFPSIFENVLNKRLAARYAAEAPTYRRVARGMTFMDFRPHPVVRPGDFPGLQEIDENGEITYGTFSESKETVAVKSYARAIRISRHMIVNDNLNAIADVLADRGRAIAQFEDTTFYSMMLGGSSADGPTLNETSRQVFNTTDKSKASSGGAIGVSTLSAGRAAIRKREGLDGAKLNLSPSILLVGPDNETAAQQIVAPIQADQQGNVNPFSGTLQIVTTSEITGNAWYLFADPAMAACFVYGFLEGYEAPRVRTEEPFGTQGMAMSVEHDFGVGAIDYRGGWKNAGS